MLGGRYNMKLKKSIKALSCLMVFIILSGFVIGADVAQSFKVITESKPLYTVKYNGYDITASRIRMEGSNNIAYCLEINKSYPTGQTFSSIGNLTPNISNIVAAGYPNRSAAELNLDNENEAYFATQVAIWCGMEGYDVNKFTGDNPKIIEAIKNIYLDGMGGKYSNKIRVDAYKTNNESIQEIITIHTDDLIAEQKAESMQKEYPPQEG